jgi:hypothetical protein
MPSPTINLPDEPTESSISALTRNLRSDCEKKGVSSKNYAHRARVIRQQKELLARGRRRERQATYAGDERQSDAQESTFCEDQLEPNSFTIFSPALGEVALNATSDEAANRQSEEENWENEGGHMSSTSGALKHVKSDRET